MNIVRRLPIIFLITLFILSCDKTTTGSDPVSITFPDANFEALIREALEKPDSDILKVDLETITKLDGTDREIVSITGIEYCINLEELILHKNLINDISSIAYLSKLTKLRLSLNKFTKIDAIANLTNLNYLSLGDNTLSNISPISGLTNLTTLFLNGTQLSDLSMLAGLSNISYLNLRINDITNLSVLSGLSTLDHLLLTGNNITDILPLVNNSGFGNGDRITLDNNPLSDTSINTYIPQLEARGVTVNR